MKFSKFIRIVTGGGTRSEIYSIYDALVDYMHKYANGTFLTRWYWLRKARKCNDVLKEIIQLNEESLK